MNIDMKYLTVATAKNSEIPGTAAICLIIFIVAMLISFYYFKKDLGSPIFVISCATSIVMGLLSLLSLFIYISTTAIDVQSLDESSDVTITQIDNNDYTGTHVNKHIAVKNDNNGYANIDKVSYIKDGKMYTDGVIIIHQGRAGLFSNGSQSLSPVLANK